AQKADSVTIKNFGTGDYKAASINYSGVMDSQGYLYFANENGILKYDGSEWEIIPIVNFSATYSVHIGPDGRFYVGGYNEFGYLEKDSLNNYKYISLREVVPEEMDYGTFWQIETIDNQVYFSSYKGLIRYDGESGTVIDIKNAGILTVEGNLLASKFDGGIYNIEGDSAVLLNDQYTWKDDNVYLALPKIGNDSTFLMFTSQNGIYEYFPKSNKIIPFAESTHKSWKKSGIYDVQIFRDSLYAITTWYNGLKLMNPKGEVVKTIDKSKGLQTSELRDFIIDKRGNIWIGSILGVSYLQWPTAYPEKGYEPSTSITEVSSNYDIDNALRSLEFHFATPGYDKSDLQYAYYLRGYDQTFSEWKSDIKKEYTNLDGGEYSFEVKALLPDGTETSVASHAFTIPTPWYKNNYYYAIGIVLLALIIVGFYRYRTARLKHLNRRLETIIHNRTKELILQREQLKEANEELIVANTELDNFVYRSSHDLVAPLKSLKGLINLAQLENPDENQKQYLNMMNTSVAKLEDFIKSIMEYSTNAKREVASEDVAFDTVISSICDDLKYYENAHRVELLKEYPTDLVIKSDEKRLKIVLSNLITNCVKYHNYEQPEPIIKVIVHQDSEKGTTKIEVADNGMGIDQEHLDKIFDMFFRASNDKAEGSGLGLYIVKDTVGKLGGHIEVSSHLGEGTTFTLTLYDSINTLTMV
ncbi:ATP-binding protein, partial [Fulvivirga lutimaris]|uniref:ATP-binding protein n=1 Tax=Fulvivirga lutimaris TaxID=1819566 RepID=UPI001FECCF2C